MLTIQEENSVILTTRPQDISDWQETGLNTLSTKGRRRFHKRKAAIVAYFTTDMPLEEISAEHNLPVEEISKLAKRCLLPHEDGNPWGFRALLPGVKVVDHSSIPETPRPDAAADVGDAPGAILADIPETPRPDVTEDFSITKTATLINESAISEAASGDEDKSADAINRVPIGVDGLIGEAALAISVSATEAAEEPSSAIGTRLIASAALAPSLASADTLNRSLRVPRYVKTRTGSHKMAQQRRMIQRHIQRKLHEKSKRRTFHRIMSMSILAVMLLIILIPLGVGLEAYNLYNNVNGVAHDGINQLLAVKDLIPSKSDPMAALNTEKLQEAKSSFKNAEGDFMQLQQLVNRPDAQWLVEQIKPDYSPKLVSARHLVKVALDVSRMGQELTDVGLIGTNIIHGSPLANSTEKPLISVDNFSTIQGTLVHALYYIDDIQSEMGQVHLKDLPISAKQQAQLVGLLAELPKARDMIIQGQGLMGSVSWLLGIGHERNFLIQTLDRGELRASGGFTGQYGTLQIKDGSMGSFSLNDVNKIDYGGNGVAYGRPSPSEYRNWMNFGNWGLRDSNLSGDYPTTARMSMQVFEEEGGGPVDGDISFTPTFISHILDVVGPIHVGDQFNETVTSQNLEERIHYWQQDQGAISREQQITGVYNQGVRKTFTTLVGKLLLDKIRHLPTKQLMDVVKNATKDIQSHDLEIYFTDPGAEQWLVDHGYSGSFDAFTKQDGFAVNQANISISKASQFVHTTESDDITLDAQGGAFHDLTITLNYRQTGPVYGYDTYADYIRAYVPASAQFRGGYGFDDGRALCKPAPPPKPGDKNPPPPPPKPGDKPPDPSQQSCDKYKTAPPDNSGYRQCYSGNYQLGDRNFQLPWPIDGLTGPTSRASDLPGHAMWGGLTVTPKNCTSYISLRWYVPNAVQHDAQGHPFYSMIVQKQGGYIPTIEINIDASHFNGLKSTNFKDDIVADKLYTISS